MARDRDHAIEQIVSMISHQSARTDGELQAIEDRVARLMAKWSIEEHELEAPPEIVSHTIHLPAPPLSRAAALLIAGIARMHQGDAAGAIDMTAGFPPGEPTCSIVQISSDRLGIVTSTSEAFLNLLIESAKNGTIYVPHKSSQSSFFAGWASRVVTRLTEAFEDAHHKAGALVPANTEAAALTAQMTEGMSVQDAERNVMAEAIGALFGDSADLSVGQNPVES